ncbi:MAG: hypothetical protein MJE77_00770 [Proteobacteria bacterium]|nr:hypothetical protein [Pseudomonadota bacterium]
MQTRGFCPWYPVAEIEDHAPAAPGVFQVRLKFGLVGYPRGKSAMIHYGYADDLRQGAGAWADSHGARIESWLCRHITGPAPDMAAEFDNLMMRFVSRFGQPPSLPDALLSNGATLPRPK